jgi:rhodanese-related sulfurtransferase
MTRLFLLLFLMVYTVACQSQGNQSTSTQSQIEVLPKLVYKEKIENSIAVQLVDVRTPAEYSAGHIDQALNIDYNAPTFEQRIQTLDKTKPVYIYCQSGGRSSRAAKVMQSLGFQEIYDLQGGYLAWQR